MVQATHKPVLLEFEGTGVVRCGEGATGELGVEGQVWRGKSRTVSEGTTAPSAMADAARQTTMVICQLALSQSTWRRQSSSHCLL